MKKIDEYDEDNVFTKLMEEQQKLLHEDVDDPIINWKIKQEGKRDPRILLRKQGKMPEKFKDYKRSRISYWDLTPEDMNKIGISVKSLVGIPSFGVAAHGVEKTPVPVSNPVVQQVVVKRQSKRIYVGSIPNQVTEEDLRAFFNAQMIQRGLVNQIKGDAVIGCKINYAKSFCFLDFRSEEEATKCLELNGLKLQDNTLRIRRPTDYQGATPEETQAQKRMKEMSEEERTVSDVLNLSMRMESAIVNLSKHYKLKVEPTPVLVLYNMINIEDYVKDEDYIDLGKDVRKEVEKYGNVVQIVIPRKYRDGFKSGFGKIFIEYSTKEEAKNACMKIQGKKFEGRSIITSYHDYQRFLNKDY